MCSAWLGKKSGFFDDDSVRSQALVTVCDYFERALVLQVVTSGTYKTAIYKS